MLGFAATVRPGKVAGNPDSRNRLALNTKLSRTVVKSKVSSLPNPTSFQGRPCAIADGEFVSADRC